MSSSVSKRISIISNQQGIVVRGLKRRFEEDGHAVRILPQKASDVRECTKDTDVFIMNLDDEPGKNPHELIEIFQIGEIISEAENKLVIIAAKNSADEVKAAAPVLSDYPWEFRPVIIEEFCQKMQDSVFSDNSAKKSQTGKKKILIIDDDPQFAKMIREWIKDTYSVGVLTAGMQAITLLTKNKVDLILLDYEMPVVDGPQVFQILKSDPVLKSIPVVFLTGVADKESVTRVMALHPNGYILKSTTRENLLTYLEDLFRKLS